MGMMNKMRENTGVILWILVFAFGVIWVLQDTGAPDLIGQVGSNIGSVNGDPIAYEEYSLLIDQQAQNYQVQTGESMPPQMLDQTRDRVFNQMVDNKLRHQETERLGLEVTDAELVEMVQGDNPHSLILTYFGDGQGNVDRALLQSYINNPETSIQWLDIENYLRDERLREKLDKLIAGTVRISNGDIVTEHRRRNNKVDVRFVSLRFTALPDDSIAYGDNDLREFYSNHRSEFERKRSYSLSYVSRSKNPTAEDSTAVFNDLDNLRESFESTADDSLFLIRNGSERPYTDAYFRPDELDEEISSAVFSGAGVGSVVGPIITQNQAHFIKILDTRPPEEVAVRASHILFRASEDDADARSAARLEAQDLLRRIRNGEDFTEMAREFSQDAATPPGGDLGWFGPGRMVEAFEEAAFGARVGSVVGPVETQFGFHLIKVTERATIEAQIADFALSFRASVATLNRVQEQLDDLQYFTEENGNFVEEATRRELEVLTVQVEAGQSFIPGIGNSRALLNFLETADPGNVSLVIELNDDFIVAVVEEIIPEGFRPFEDVRGQIEPRLRNELKSDIQAARAKEALDGGFDGLAARLGTAEQTAEGLSFSNMVVTGIGRDPKFVGTAMGLEVGETSDVISGANAVYVIHLENAEDAGVLSDADREQIAQQLLTSRQTTLRSQWITSLQESADIIDNRRLFLQ